MCTPCLYANKCRSHSLSPGLLVLTWSSQPTLLRITTVPARQVWPENQRLSILSSVVLYKHHHATIQRLSQHMWSVTRHTKMTVTVPRKGKPSVPPAMSDLILSTVAGRYCRAILQMNKPRLRVKGLPRVRGSYN